MLRRILAVVSFALAIPMFAGALFAFSRFPVLLEESQKGPGTFFFWGTGILMFGLMFGAVASFSSAIHLYRGSRSGSAFRRFLHFSNLVFIPFAGLFFLLLTAVLGFVDHYRHPSNEPLPLVTYFRVYGVMLVPLSVIAIYLGILFWRGAAANPSQD